MKSYQYLFCLFIVGILGCGSDSKPKNVVPDDLEGALSQSKLEGVTLPKVKFTDITKEAGIDFSHTNGSFGKKLLPETMGAGVVFFDYNNDNYPDLLFVNSCHWPGHEDNSKPTLELYRNKEGKQFEKVTASTGLNITMYGMGACAGDYDNDGFLDLFVTGVGGNRLFRNVNGQRFEEVTTKAGVGGPGGWTAAQRGDIVNHKTPLPFSSSATFLDYDGDAKLDLFVCNYVTWSPTIDLAQDFRLTGIGRAFGPPRAFEGSQCFLYRNTGNGFEDVSRKAGIEVWEKEGVGDQERIRAVGKSLGVIVFDANKDGYPEIIVANDTVRNFFFQNVAGPDGTRIFQEKGEYANVAYAAGTARGAMGIDWGEYRPGRMAVLIANFSDEPCTFLKLDDPNQIAFRDVAIAEGLAGPSKPPLKFGAFFIDFDLDGRLDLLTVNGHLEPDISKVQAGQSFEQPAQLYWNTGVKQRAYERIKPEQSGKDLFKPMVGRGCAYADIDRDGDLDIVLTANGGPARLLRNEGGTGHHWIQLKLQGDGKSSNRSAIDARIEVEVDGHTLHRHIAGARGYLSQCELPITIGLGKASKVDKVTIYWPGANTSKTELKDVKIDQLTTVHP